MAYISHFLFTSWERQPLRMLVIQKEAASQVLHESQRFQN